MNNKLQKVPTNFNLILLKNDKSLNATDKKIIEYLSDLHMKNLLNCININSMSNDLKISSSQIVKTLKKVGFSGLKDLRANIFSTNQETDNLNSINNYLKETLVFSIYDSFKEIDRKDFDIFNKLVNDSHSIYFLAGGSNLYISNDYADKFNKIGKRAIVVDIAKPECYNIAENSLVIIISISGRNSKISKQVKFIKKNIKNIKIYSITFVKESYIYNYSDYEYSLSFLDNEYLNERELPRHSKILLQIFLDMLFLEYYKSNKSEFDNHMKKHLAYIVNQSK